MASNPPAGPVLSERTEIHKGCKSLESLVNVLNDYCEAAGAIVAVQKKLVKALRDAAGSKCTSEIASNALNASANIFDVLSDIDSKFAKFADRECDGVSTEVKKWFKKLAKEEKAHDQRIATANNRIKQAGQSFEKKSKKSVQDATDEHARYINLLSALGPEMSQEKHNHALFVTQRHTSTTYSVAAGLSRIADAEWLRSCEGVRRFAPSVGQLSEWRMYCEGGWIGEIPKDIPGPDDQPAHLPHRHDNGQDVTELSDKALEANINNRQVLSPNDAGQDLRIPHGPMTPSGQYTPMEQPPPQYNASPSVSGRQQASSAGTEGSLADRHRGSEDGRPQASPQLSSLASFPPPPAHFPIPPIIRNRLSSSDPPSPDRPPHDDVRDPQQQSQSQTSSSVSQKNVTVLPRLAESPQEEVRSATSPAPKVVADQLSINESHSAESSQTNPPKSLDQQSSDSPPANVKSNTVTRGSRPLPDPVRGMAHRQESEKFASSSKSGAGSIAGNHRGGDYWDDREFGMKKSGPEGEIKAKTVDSAARSKELERKDSLTGSGSVVAAMRSRYDRGTGTSSPPPKEVPRVGLSVSNLANKYEGDGDPVSPRQRPTSPPDDRSLSFTDNGTRYRLPESPGRSMDIISEMGFRSEPDDFSRRRQRIGQLEDLELREKELELREREREIEQRTRELERDRARVLGSRADGYAIDNVDGRHTQTYRSQYESSRPPMSRYSYSTTHLAAPNSAPSLSQHQEQRSRSRPTTPTSPSEGHAPYCGCDRCSASKYRAGTLSPSSRDLRPPERPITLRPEKPKGWIRRLSMPVIVGNAFSIDSKKNSSTTSLAGPPSRRSTALPDETGRLVADLTSNRGVASSARR